VGKVQVPAMAPGDMAAVEEEHLMQAAAAAVTMAAAAEMEIVAIKDTVVAAAALTGRLLFQLQEHLMLLLTEFRAMDLYQFYTN
jgi:hypothetical protein